jgi:hypothetical protein
MKSTGPKPNRMSIAQAVKLTDGEFALSIKPEALIVDF